MKKAAIDIGSNSVRYAQGVVLDGELTSFEEAIEMTRLAEGFDMGKRLIGKPVERTITACREFYDRALAFGAERIILAGTAALRTAINRNDVLAPLAALPQAELRILSEQEEAEVNYLGATAERSVDEIWMVFDIGGASSELAVRREQQLTTTSIPVGALTLSKDLEMRKKLSEALQRVDFSAYKYCDGILGTGGTLTTAAFIIDEITEYEPDRINGRRIPVEVLLSTYRMLQAMSLEERKNVPGLPEGRIDTIVPGLEILFDVMAAVGQNTLTVSTDDGLKGLMLSEELD